MKAMKSTFIIGILAICMGMMSCQEDEENVNVSTIEPGTYSADIIINPEKGTTNYTRGINTDKGIFTDEYQQDYIYLHHIKEGEENSIKIPLTTDCDGQSKCFNIQVTKTDENTYTINVNNKSITLENNEQIYFSTVSGQTWKAIKAENNYSPNNEITIFEQPETTDEILEREILKSDNYSGETLLGLMTGDTQYIPVTRHVSGFKIHILFTNADVRDDEDHILQEEGGTDYWKEVLGNNISPNDFKIKIYFGPNFCEWYDVLNNNAQGSGYYASHNQEYVTFEEVNEEHQHTKYEGYGYNTPHTLLSPLYTEKNDEFQIYMCIQYKDGLQYYYTIKPKNLTMNLNTIHHIILAYDVHDLLPIVNGTGGTYSSESRAGSAYQKIDLKPFKIICE